jgi:predicted Zn-dependent protease
MRYQWPAYYLDGLTAARHPASVRLMRVGLEVTTGDGGPRLWPFAELRQTQGFYEGQVVRLEHGGELAEALLIPEPGFLTSLHEVAPQLGSRFHNPARRQSRLRLTVLAAVAIVGVTGALYFWGIPALAALVTPRVPVGWEQRLGQSAVSGLVESGTICHNPAGDQAIAAIVARLAAAAPKAPYKFRVLVLNRADVNALAVPGGDIIVFQGLLDRTNSPEELAGVLAHEMEHILLRHATRALIQHVSVGLLVAAVTGDMTGPLAYGLESARVLGQLQYSRRTEVEADANGLQLLMAARVDPTGMINFLSGLLQDKKMPRSVLRYLSTHPSTGDRVDWLKDLVARASAPSVKLLPDVDWNQVKHVCPPGGPGAAPTEPSRSP